MKNYNKTDYAINKYSKAIVCKFSDCILKVTFEKISAENPNFTKEDFEKLKQLSDQMYLEQVRGDDVENSHKIAILDNDEYSGRLAAPSLEEMIFSEDKYYQYLQEVYIVMDKCLTTTQKRRYILHKINGLSTSKIAKKKGVNQNAVWKSIYKVLTTLSIYSHVISKTVYEDTAKTLDKAFKIAIGQKKTDEPTNDSSVLPTTYSLEIVSDFDSNADKLRRF